MKTLYETQIDVMIDINSSSNKEVYYPSILKELRDTLRDKGYDDVSVTVKSVKHSTHITMLEEI